MPTPRGAIPALFLTLMIVAGCASGTSSPTAATATGDPTATASPSSTGSVVAGTHDDPADYEWDESSEVTISLADGASSGADGVTVEGDVVTITNAGTYRLSGSLSDGQVAVDTEAEGVVRLVLDGASVASSTTSPLVVVDAEKVVIILATGSQNVLTDAASYEFESPDVDEPNAALFSTADLTIAGEGSLTVDGNFNDGITGKDGLIVAGGSIEVTAVDDGIRGKDYLIVSARSVTVTAGGDALKADNEEDATLGYVAIAGGTIDLTAGSDAIDAASNAIADGGSLTIEAGDDAIHAETRLEINGGSIDIVASYEGLEATQIVITGGVIELVAEDDGLNVAGGTASGNAQLGLPGTGGGRGGPGGETALDGYFVEMSGGTLVIDAGGDGFDSNGSATVTGGTIVINGPTENMNGAIDVNGEFLISNAILIAAGSAGMAETPSATSEQPNVALNFSSVQPAGTVVRIQAPDGTNIATFQASKPFQALVFSSPDITAGTTYEVLTGGSADGDSLGGLFLEPAYTPGTVIGSVVA